MRHSAVATPTQQDGFSVVELLIALVVIAIASAMTAPLMGNMLANARLSGDARAVANSTAVAKMRAAAAFSSARLFVNVPARTYRIEVWQKTGTPGWVAEGPAETLSNNVVFGFGSLAAAPPNTQGTIGQAAACRDDLNVVIPNTACVVFNSRGLPVDSTGSPTGSGAYYLADSTAVFGVTVSATGMVRSWRAALTGSSQWIQQ